MKFYKSEKDNTIRVVQELGNGYFVVVKLFGDDNVASMKIWHGDLARTASFWSTKPFTPASDERQRLVRAFRSVRDKMVRVLLKGGHNASS